ncbi:MAG TPA: hypothetical protein VJ739_04000, partial [Gemmataceae bacterium]|nr:hypothetical protein [Gemmataceae bacterium]
MVTLAGVTNGTCLTCDGFNGSYVLTPIVPCGWQYSFPSTPPCPPYLVTHLDISRGTNTQTIAWTLQSVVWQKTAPVIDCLATQALALTTSNGDCGWPGAVTVT